MLRHGVIAKNFKFLILEVIKQLERTEVFLRNPPEMRKLRREIQSRDDYIDHLKGIIENKSFAFLRRRDDLDKKTGDRVHSLNIVTNNLERIADYSVSVVGQTDHFTDPLFLHRYDYAPFFQAIVQSLGLVMEAFKEVDTKTAITICESELELDEMYKGKFERILAEMVVGEDIPNLVTSLFIFHYLERMGDCLLNIGEAILFSKMGEKLKFRQFQALKETVGERGKEQEALKNVDFEGIWGSRSGCRIGKVTDKKGNQGEHKEVIFKEGDEKKIRDEREKIEQWSEVFPGLPPKVVEYRENSRDAALVVEYLDGHNLQELVLNTEPDLLDEALETVEGTVRTIWDKTKSREPVKPLFLAQMKRRLDDVYRVHPYFRDDSKKIGRLHLPRFDELLRENEVLDELLEAPFSIFGHGDFNLDNVIYDARGRRVHFIDVHRSSHMDYAQDVSVFLISSFRMPVFDRKLRQRLNRVIISFYEFASDFARDNGDETFQARLGLGLVRSFVTSTRFELERVLAENMIQRAAYLLRRIGGLREKMPAGTSGESAWSEFTLPMDVLFF